MNNPFRILSLDGGGIMGAFAASASASFEQATRCKDMHNRAAPEALRGEISVANRRRAIGRKG